MIARMNVGGPAVQVSGLSAHLSARSGVEHVLITGVVGEDEQDYLERHVAPFERIIIPELGRRVTAKDDAVAAARLTAALRRFKPDVVHTHTAKAGALGRPAARVAAPHAKVVHTYHGHLLKGYFGPAKTRLVVGVERSLALISDALVTVGTQVRDDLLEAGVGRLNKYRVIPPGIPRLAGINSVAARRSLELPLDRPVVSFVGRLTEIKRPDRLCDVAALVTARVPDVMFVVAGEGSQADYVRRRAEREHLPIVMLGWLDDVADVLCASDVCLLTSDNEGTPISLIQAAMVGVPAVATGVGSVAEVVAEGSTGFVRTPDALALAEAVCELLEDPGERARMGAEARNFSMGFTVEALASNHLELYLTLLRA